MSRSQSSNDETEAKLHAGEHFDVLVVPVQIQRWGFDRATRSLMTAELAAAIARSGRSNVPDPYLVANLFGDGQRQYSQDEVSRVARMLGVKRVVSVYAGHDGNGNMLLTGMATSPNTVDEKRIDKMIHFDAKLSPLDAYESSLDELLKGLGIQPAAASAAPANDGPRSATYIGELPDAPAKLFSGDEPTRNAYALFLLNALTPRNMERASERFAEKAFMATARIDRSSPEYRVLRARAYLTMGFRPFAVRLLATPQTDEERALVATLQGDLPRAVELAAKERSPVKRLLQTLDAIRIASDYGKADRTEVAALIQSLRLPGKVWTYLAVRAAIDWDMWSQFDNASLKAILDREFPIEGYAMRDIVGGALSVSAPERALRAADLGGFRIEGHLGAHGRSGAFRRR